MTKSAYLTKSVLPYLSEAFEITIFSDCFESWSEFRCEHYLAFSRLDKVQSYDAVVYQVEDHKDLGFSRFHIGLRPGVVLFHDLLLRTPQPEPLVKSPWSMRSKSKLGAPIWAGRDQFFDDPSPYANRELALGAVVAFFSSRQCSDALDRYSKLKEMDAISKAPKTYTLPYPTLVASGQSSKESLKISFCGGLEVQDRVHSILSALSMMPTESQFDWSATWLVRSEDYQQACDFVKDRGAHCQVITGLNPQSWAELSSASDVAIHLLFSVFGSVEPYLSISLANSCYCLVSDFALRDEHCSSFVIPIKPGASEALELLAALSELNECKSKNEALMSNFSSEWARENSAEVLAAQIAQLIYSEIDELRSRAADDRDLAALARSALLDECLELYSTKDAHSAQWFRTRQAVFDKLGWTLDGVA